MIEDEREYAILERQVGDIIAVNFDTRLRVSAASGSERGFRKGLIDGASLATARGTDPEVACTDR